MNIDWSVKVTDLIMIGVAFLGPIAAVQISEFLRSKADAKNRRVHIFRTLMATRSATLLGTHIEAINLVEVEFTSGTKAKQVVDAWRLYLSHLGDHLYPKDHWGAKREELMVEMLYVMAESLGYSYDKAALKRGYYPSGYESADRENQETRALWLDILRGNRQLPMKVEVSQPAPTAESKSQNSASD